MRHQLLRSALITCFALFASSAIAQPGFWDRGERLGVSRYRDGKDLKNVFRPVVAEAAKSTVRIRCGGKDAELGTIVGADGWILTKFSELRAPVTCRLSDGRELAAKLVGVHPGYDLAMLKIEAEKLTAVDWNKNSDPAVGQLVATAGLGEDPLAVGVISVPRRKIPGSPGILGISLDETDKGPKITQVFSGSGAEKAGLKTGDIVQRVANQIMRDRANLTETIRSHKPGDTVRLSVLRGDSEIELNATLTQPTASFLGMRSEDLNTMGGPLSNRNTDFPNVIQHDTVLRPSDCGGPIVDLSGKVIGVNIARGGRVESYSVPADQVVPLLSSLESGKLTPKDPLPTADNVKVEKPKTVETVKGNEPPKADEKSNPADKNKSDDKNKSTPKTPAPSPPKSDEKGKIPTKP